jgi:GTP:adenosylcobinamide-phosphate guanylyltransferase
MDVVITAGGIPEPDDLLYPFSQGKSKALIEVAGKPMIQWVVDAAAAVEQVERFVIVGIEKGNGIHCSKPVSFVPNQGSMLNNIRAGVKKALVHNPQAEYVMLLSSDIPAISSEMVAWAFDNSLGIDADIFYSVVPRQVMERRFPGSNRTYVRLKDMELCGGDIFIIRTVVVVGRDKIWNNLIASRKNVLKQAALIGFDTLILLLLRRFTLAGLVKRISKRLDLIGRVLISPYAEAGMDIDKPFQLQIVRQYLEAKNRDET